MVAGLLNYVAWFLESAMSAIRSFKLQSIIGFTCLIASYYCSIFIIPLSGILGAAYVTVIYSIILLVARLVAVIFLMSKFKLDSSY
jgi:hypothetical protein